MSGSTVIDQKEYLKKYISSETDTSKKKKKKIKNNTRETRIRVIDDDISVLTQIKDEDIDDDLLGTAEERPQIVAIIDERPIHMQFTKVFSSKKPWRKIGEDGDADVKISPNQDSTNEILSTQEVGENEDSFKLQIKKEIEKNKENDRLSILKEKNERKSKEISLPLKSRSRQNNPDFPTNHKKVHDSSLHNNEGNHDTDLSPPRHRKRNDSDQSPPRPRERHDSDFSSHRKMKNDNIPLQLRKRHDSDQSPPRQKSRHDSDQSPPRQRSRNDSSQAFSQQRKRHDSDQSPPRQRRKYNSDQSPPRQRSRHDSDNSLPQQRKRHGSDQSPPRQRSRHDSDQSPPRQRRRHDSDQSHPRHRKKQDSNYSSQQRSKYSSQEKTAIASKANIDKAEVSKSETLSGRKSGLQDAKSLRYENKQVRLQEEAALLEADEELLGVNADTIVRDRKTGKKIDIPAEILKKREETKVKKDYLDKYQVWSAGLKQIKDRQKKLEEMEDSSNKPLARYADDEDLENELKSRVRDGDPMLKYFARKRAKQDIKENKPRYPVYQGPPAPMNRFEILPGYRWDGVDRSNGFEKKLFESIGLRKAMEEEAYKWSSADM